jgi:hypothetical protein
MHEHVTDRLSDYLDGDLPAAGHAQVDAHLRDCDACRRVLDELRSIAGAAAALPGGMPGSDLWPGIAERIGRAPAQALPFAAAPRRRFSFTAPQLAAAAVLLMTLSGGLAVLLRPAADPAATDLAATTPAEPADVLPVNLADPGYDGAVADLERTLDAGRGRLDPETIRVLEANLTAIDAAIDECRRALEADPANTFLNSHLLSARQRKLALLRRATALTTGS